MYVYPKKYGVIVVGAGHAGVEAALASARMGCETLLLTINLDTIGQMSCNPAIGGLAKGHLTREIDALGGEMGLTTDLTGLQFRMLNTKKGPSVWAPRAQCDKKAYQFRMKWVCERQSHLDCKQGQTIRLLHEGGRVFGVETMLEVQFHAEVVVITTGTFLRGLMHVGINQQAGGRAGEAAVMGLSGSLKDVGLELGRLKTGTPPRLVRKSIDFTRCETQSGDEPVPYFTYWKEELWSQRNVHSEHSNTGGAGNPSRNSGVNLGLDMNPTPPLDLFHVEQSTSPGISQYPPGSILSQIGGQLPCYITYTSNRTRELVLANIHKSPMYSGVIEGVGPRYCPSIEDKFVRFADKEKHQIFLEPEGIHTDEIYVNGFSTCLPFEVQVEMVRSIQGCEHAEIMRPAYAVEYDFAPPTQLHPNLETKVCSNLFLAGQINGTSGYEEAGAQGLMAGINAARRVQGEAEIVLRRDQAYIGVLIDDLITKGTVEPYRMFTSRAEYRLLLRQDNADLRLSDIGHGIGLLPEHRHRRLVAKRFAIDAELKRLETTREGVDTLAQLLRRPEVSYDKLPKSDRSLSDEITQQVEIYLKYEGYIRRQEADVERFKTLEEKELPNWLNYETVQGLRTEARVKLSSGQPRTIGQASRISGVSPADISLLLVHLKKGKTSMNPAATGTQS
ncbi:MAG: tRNA uridine-5-carboxymethylaminomethyl(34) synthesis enzyme MnmG [Pedosphaera sp.]|nr:tRNA uridine-5-carboxymethylaminomethyl(34) synthesis enzyme MnmG [Pedosphaera sp.]